MFAAFCKFFVILRSLLFNIAFVLVTILISVYYSIYLIFKPEDVSKVGKTWSKYSLLLLKYICGINFVVSGKEYMPQGACILASKHQSAWDTIIFLHLFDNPAYILKKELLNIPFFGKYLSRMRMIAIDRSAGNSAVKQIIKQSKQCLDDKRAVVIFPEGTRTPPGTKRSYKPGINALYSAKSINTPIVPVALNSGYFWSKNAFIKSPGTVTIKFLPEFEKGLDKKLFLQKLEHIIEDACDTIKPLKK